MGGFARNSENKYAVDQRRRLDFVWLGSELRLMQPLLISNDSKFTMYIWHVAVICVQTTENYSARNLRDVM